MTRQKNAKWRKFQTDAEREELALAIEIQELSRKQRVIIETKQKNRCKGRARRAEQQ